MSILDSKPSVNASLESSLVLVQWKGLPVEDTTLEDLAELQKAYPELQLEDNVIFQQRRNDTSQTAYSNINARDTIHTSEQTGKTARDELIKQRISSRTKLKPPWTSDYERKQKNKRIS